MKLLIRAPLLLHLLHHFSKVGASFTPYSLRTHPNNWAFVRGFAILCYNLSLTPSVDTFLFFFEVKDPGKKLWVSFNGVAGRVLLTLFQQSYKGFKKNFFKINSNQRDPALLDGFPLYWTEKPILQRP